MKKVIILTVVLVFLFSLCANAEIAKEEASREGICGTRTAQPGPEPVCLPSTETCYIKIYFTDGSTGEEEWKSIYIPSEGKGYFDINDITHTNLNTGFRVNIFMKSTTIPISASNVEQFVNIIKNME